MKQYAQHRKLPNGRDYCFELSETEKAQDDCTADLEEALFYSNADKDDIVALLQLAFARVKEARNPCNWVARLLRRERCMLDD